MAILDKFATMLAVLGKSLPGLGLGRGQGGMGAGRCRMRIGSKATRCRRYRETQRAEVRRRQRPYKPERPLLPVDVTMAFYLRHKAALGEQ